MSNSEPEMRILKSATCKSISGKSTLTYQIGCLPDSTVHLRISKNSAAGFFNDEWIALKDIERVLAESPEGQPLTSFLLQPLFNGKSVNTPAFLMAALTHEKFLRVLKGKKRGHELLDPEGFDAKIELCARHFFNEQTPQIHVFCSEPAYNVIRLWRMMLI